MNVLMIGGTGLIGSEAARVLIARGHTVRTLALPPVPQGAPLPQEMAITFADYMALSDEALGDHLAGCDGLVFAAGIDERVEGPPPIFTLFEKYNLTPLERLLRLAKASGVRRAAICGSYFCHFARLWPHLELERYHPYIRSRMAQERMALSFADADFSVAMLELPYIFGAQPGRKPVWLFLAEQVRGMPLATFYPPGGSAMITARQAGEALAGALERNRGGTCYPVGYANLSWTELLRIVHRHMGCPDKPVVTIPKGLFRLSCRAIRRKQRRAGHEGGLDLVRFADVMCANTFIEPALGAEPLGVSPDDLDAAIGSSFRLCLDILDGRREAIGMRGD
ncbi:MAG: NAD(P)H-binding protein [Clostridiaceae bacterium]|nr:NAD(P)H-binding protein [Clostridiaceae bacterium]